MKICLRFLENIFFNHFHQILQIQSKSIFLTSSNNYYNNFILFPFILKSSLSWTIPKKRYLKDFSNMNQRLREFLGQIVPIYTPSQFKIKTKKKSVFHFFQFSSKFTMPGSIFLKNDKFCVKSITDYMDPYFKLKPPDCYLYAEDGYKFDIHKVCLQIFFSVFFTICP